MAYNSSAGSSNQDDSDITIINPSIIHEHNDENVNNTYVPIITRLKEANNSSENRQITNSRINNTYQSVDNNNEYIFVHHNPLENAKSLEQVLKYYIGDLKQETNTQLDCDKQLVTRLMDLIRPAYVNDQQKMTQLDNIMEEIGLLHDKRHIEQKEKIEKLRTEICRLNKMLITASNDDSLYIDNNNRNSMFSTMNQEHSINDYDQWTEIEDDAKKLHKIVQSQKDQINEIVTLISQTATASTSLDTPSVPINQSKETETDKPITPSTNTNVISTLLQKIKDITGKQQQPVTTAPTSNISLTNPSPGNSPSESMATIIADLLTPPIDNPTEKTDDQRSIHNPPKQTDNQQPIHDPPHVPIDIPTTPLPVEPKKCPVCNHEFSGISDDVDMYDHIEKCLFPTGTYTEPKDYTCPNCDRKYPTNEEAAYHQHLADCYRDM